MEKTILNVLIRVRVMEMGAFVMSGTLHIKKKDGKNKAFVEEEIIIESFARLLQLLSFYIFCLFANI